jgi:hypothetical protein
MRRILSVPIALALLLLAGCATDQRNQTLTATLNAYANTVRWGNLANAEQFVDPDVREAHPLTPLDRSRFKQLRIGDYDDGQGPIADGENKVRQVVHIGVINIHTQQERTITDRQSWRYDPQAKHWWLTSGLPDFAEH